MLPGQSPRSCQFNGLRPQLRGVVARLLTCGIDRALGVTSKKYAQRCQVREHSSCHQLSLPLYLHAAYDLFHYATKHAKTEDRTPALLVETQHMLFHWCSFIPKTPALRTRRVRARCPAVFASRTVGSPKPRSEWPTRVPGEEAMTHVAMTHVVGDVRNRTSRVLEEAMKNPGSTRVTQVERPTAKYLCSKGTLKKMGSSTTASLRQVPAAAEGAT